MCTILPGLWGVLEPESREKEGIRKREKFCTFVNKYACQGEEEKRKRKEEGDQFRRKQVHVILFF